MSEGRRYLPLTTRSETRRSGATAFDCTRRSPARSIGGVGPGLSPRAALALGLKVDVDASAAQPRVGALRRGEVNLDDPGEHAGAASAQRGRRRDRILRERQLASIDRHPVRACATRPWTIASRPASGSGWMAGRTAISTSARSSRWRPTCSPSPILLGVDERDRAHGPEQLGAGQIRRRSCSSTARRSGPTASPAATLIPPGVRPGRRQPAHLDRVGRRHALERVRREPRDARQGHVLRSAPERSGAVPDRRAEPASGNVQQHARPRHAEARRAALLSARDPRARRRRPDSFDRDAATTRRRRVHGQGAVRDAATSRRSSRSRAGTCTRPRRSASTTSRRIARPIAATGPRR